MKRSAYREAEIYVRDDLAGILRETDEGYSFTYDDAYVHTHPDIPVSLTLPVRAEPYHAKVLFPFFDGLIPEGWLLHIAVQNWKLDERDRFGLLLVACRDCIGCVSVREASS